MSDTPRYEPIFTVHDALDILERPELGGLPPARRVRLRLALGLRVRLWAENAIHRLFGGEDNAYCRFRWCARCNWFRRISQPHESAAMERRRV